jgi:hypothetical protein
VICRRPGGRLLDNVAARDQHRNHDRHVPHRVPDPEHAEPRITGGSAQLDELISVSSGSDAFIDVEHMSDEQAAALLKRFHRLASKVAGE